VARILSECDADLSDLIVILTFIKLFNCLFAFRAFD
jgi:hypothetical protein